MEIKQINFECLVQQYYESDKVQYAVEYLDRFDPFGYSEELKDMLRHHRERPIESEEEIEIRDAMDYLLGFYGLVEIASLANYIPEELPETFRAKAFRHLNQPDVARYYEEHYVLLLPQLLRRRLSNDGWNMREAEPDEDESTDQPERDPRVQFMRFLDLTTQRQHDPHIDMFLWFLDDGIAGGYAWPDLLPILPDAKRFAERVTRRPEKQTALDHALIGLSKYLVFCSELDFLLERNEHFPLLRSAMWHYHSYWFDHMQEKVWRELNRAMDNMHKWREYADNPELFDVQLTQSLRTIRKSISRLVAGLYKEDLLAAARGELQQELREIRESVSQQVGEPYQEDLLVGARGEESDRQLATTAGDRDDFDDRDEVIASS
jgi:hypothetical protein